jgi:hypothetical protein
VSALVLNHQTRINELLLTARQDATNRYFW